MALVPLLAALAIAASAPSTSSANQPSAQGTEICVEGPQWRPTVEDSANIEAQPIPPSYRAMFESSDPCVRWSMGDENILPWLLHFGSARSASVALAYLERDYTRPSPDVGALLGALR